MYSELVIRLFPDSPLLHVTRDGVEFLADPAELIGQVWGVRFKP